MCATEFIIYWCRLILRRKRHSIFVSGPCLTVLIAPSQGSRTPKNVHTFINIKYPIACSVVLWSLPSDFCLKMAHAFLQSTRNRPIYIMVFYLKCVQWRNNGSAFTDWWILKGPNFAARKVAMENPTSFNLLFLHFFFLLLMFSLLLFLFLVILFHQPFFLYLQIYLLLPPSPSSCPWLHNSPKREPDAQKFIVTS